MTKRLESEGLRFDASAFPLLPVLVTRLLPVAGTTCKSAVIKVFDLLSLAHRDTRFQTGKHCAVAAVIND